MCFTFSSINYDETKLLTYDVVKDILYFFDEDDADDYVSGRNNFIKKFSYVIEKNESIEIFNINKLKENALNKLTKEEKEILGLL